MKQILIPISFSEASANSVRKAISIFENYELTLLHCYSPYDYNREFNFGKKSYNLGIEDMLLDFFRKNTTERNHKVKLIACSGSVSETISEISDRYDLLIMSKRKLKEKGGYWFSDRVTYIASKGHCPVLLLPIDQNKFNFKSCKNIWHLKRKENESMILSTNLPNIDVDLKFVEVKHLEQTVFKSPLWKAVLFYSRKKDEAILREISNAEKIEQVDLIILVSHKKASFQNFMKAEVIQIINQFDIPLLVLQA